MKKIISQPQITDEGPHAVYTVSIGGETLWFRTESANAHLISDSSDAVAIGLIYHAMKHNYSIHFEGHLSEEVAYNVSGPLQAALIAINPRLKRIEITQDKIKNSSAGSGVATGFSGGIDSFGVAKRHILESPPQGYKVTHLTLHDVWNKENFVDFQSGNIKKGMKNVGVLAEKWGLQLATISSNLGMFYSGIRFEDTHTLRNAAAAHFVAGGIGKYIYASGYPLEMQALAGASALAKTDVIILPMVSSASLRCISGDPEFNRVEKTERIISVEETKDYLHVCGRTWHANCSGCAKCRRTILTLDVLGQLENYTRVFNVEKYRREKSEWLTSDAVRKDTYLQEIDNYARSRDINILSM